MADQPSTVGLANRQVTRGILMMLLAYFLFSFVDTSTKWLLAAGLPALQMAFMRYAVSFAITIVDSGRNGFRGFSMPRARAGLVVLRGLLLVSATVVNFFALQFLPLSVTAAMMFTAPIIVCLLSGPLLGERVGVWRWTAILFGFVGVLIIIRPFGGSFSWPALMMLYPATCMALYSILTRMLVNDVEASVMQFSLGLVGTVALAPFALALWSPPSTATEAFLLPMIGVFAWAGHEILIRAHRYAPANVLMPFTYSYLIYLSFAGFLLFREVPDGATILGALIIVASGLAIWARERGVTDPAS